MPIYTEKRLLLPEPKGTPETLPGNLQAYVSGMRKGKESMYAGEFMEFSGRVWERCRGVLWLWQQQQQEGAFVRQCYPRKLRRASGPWRVVSATLWAHGRSKARFIGICDTLESFQKP